MKAEGKKARKTVALARKTGKPSRQLAALTYRIDEAGTVEVLLVTSRETRRFVIPKGWPIKGLHPADAAAREAFEEAGVRGKVLKKKIGSYRYWKRMAGSFLLVRVDVFPLRVELQREHWPEAAERVSSWLPIADAALLVDEPDLAALLRSFGEEMTSKPTGKTGRKRTAPTLEQQPA